ncbi:hypothetical protein BIW11_12524 [Tropilaelaps mercedesae]|uniref:Uncharacterized protein n=1 Tax=Tropilaelaps mercedesae TaxID=418985 RepID=A0A1V9X6N0_9ACAR|nr:hypothetical protein BIW11_12524 [Tropilaelaps mercedesae]
MCLREAVEGLKCSGEAYEVTLNRAQAIQNDDAMRAISGKSRCDSLQFGLIGSAGAVPSTRIEDSDSRIRDIEGKNLW